MTRLLNSVVLPLNRKFADIEAANHRLASALYFKGEEKNASNLPAEERDIADPSGVSEAVAATGSNALFNPGDDDSSGEKESEPGNLWKHQPKPHARAGRGENNAAKQQENKTHKLVETPSSSAQAPPNSPPERANDATDPQTAQPDSGHMELARKVDTLPASSPGLGPLSPAPCDLSVWMVSDVSTCMQGQKSIADVSESQWSEIADLLGVGSPDRAYAEVEAYVESICARRGDPGQEVESAEFAFADLFDSFIENLDESVLGAGALHGDTCEYMYEGGHSCQEGTQRQNEDALNAAQVAVEQPPPASLGYRSDGSELQACQHPQEGPCALGSRAPFTPFEGVAQSFAVPLHYSRSRAIPTLPREEDWPFTDILEDRVSMYG